MPQQLKQPLFKWSGKGMYVAKLHPEFIMWHHSMLTQYWNDKHILRLYTTNPHAHACLQNMVGLTTTELSLSPRVALERSQIQTAYDSNGTQQLMCPRITINSKSCTCIRPNYIYLSGQNWNRQTTCYGPGKICITYVSISSWYTYWGRLMEMWQAFHMLCYGYKSCRAQHCPY